MVPSACPRFLSSSRVPTPSHPIFLESTGTSSCLQNVSLVSVQGAHDLCCYSKSVTQQVSPPFLLLWPLLHLVLKSHLLKPNSSHALKTSGGYPSLPWPCKVLCAAEVLSSVLCPGDPSSLEFLPLGGISVCLSLKQPPWPPGSRDPFRFLLELVTA